MEQNKNVHDVMVIPCGTIVTTVIGGIEGMITAISLRFDRVQYGVSYFTNGEQKEVWMNESEFTVYGGAIKTPIGYYSTRT